MKLRFFYLSLFSLLGSLCPGLYIGENYTMADCKIRTVIDPATMDIQTLATLSPGR